MKKPFQEVTDYCRRTNLKQNPRKHGSMLAAAIMYVSTWASTSLPFYLLPRETYMAKPSFNSTFAAITLTPDDVARFTEWVVEEKPDPRKALDDFLGGGFKLSVSWVVDQNAFCFTVIGTDATKLHKGLVMTSWSDDLDEVILLAWFKHAMMCDGNAWPVRESGQRWG